MATCLLISIASGIGIGLSAAHAQITDLVVGMVAGGGLGCGIAIVVMILAWDRTWDRAERYGKFLVLIIYGLALSAMLTLGWWSYGRDPTVTWVVFLAGPIFILLASCAGMWIGSHIGDRVTDRYVAGAPFGLLMGLASGLGMGGFAFSTGMVQLTQGLSLGGVVGVALAALVVAAVAGLTHEYDDSRWYRFRVLIFIVGGVATGLAMGWFAACAEIIQLTRGLCLGGGVGCILSACVLSLQLHGASFLFGVVGGAAIGYGIAAGTDYLHPVAGLAVGIVVGCILVRLLVEL